MATTITTDKNWDTLTNNTANDTYNINGAKLTVDTDTKYCSNHTSITGAVGSTIISSSLGGEIYLDGTKVRLIPYDTGTGNVPTIGTTITGEGCSAYLLGVWSAIDTTPTAAGSAMPASGWIKVKNVTGGSFAAGALTGIEANATGADVPGWIEFAMGSSYGITCPRLGKITSRGDWLELGTTSGSPNQTLKIPNCNWGAVWIETGAGTNEYEIFLRAGSITAFSTDSRSKVVFGTNTLVRIGNNGSTTSGYCPASGRRVRIPNIIWTHTNSTTGGGNIDLENIIWGSDSYTFNMRNGYRNKLKNCSFVTGTGSVGITTVPQEWENVAFGTIAGASTANNFYGIVAGAVLTKCSFLRNNVSSTTPGTRVQSCRNIIFNDCSFIDSGKAAYSSYAIYVLMSQDITFNNTKVVGGFICIDNSENIDLNNTIYADYVDISTPTTWAGSGIRIWNKATNITIDGFAFPSDCTNVHPYNTVFDITNACSGILIKNIGTPSSPLNLGTVNAAGDFLQPTTGSGGCVSNVKVQRCYVTSPRSNNFCAGWDGGQFNIIFENCGNASAFNVLNTASTCYQKGFRGGANTIPTAANNISGTHFYDIFTSDTGGRIGLFFHEPNDATAQYVIGSMDINSNFLATGTLAMKALNDTITYTWPHYILGYTSLANIAPTKTGTNTGNFSYEYDLDKGAGFSGTWQALTAANLSAETGITATTGFKPKIRITCTTASTTNALTGLYFIGTTDATSQQTLYPLETVTVTVGGLIDGTQVFVAKVSDDSVVMNGTAGGGGATTNIEYASDIPVYVRARKAGYREWTGLGTITSQGLTLTAQQVADTIYQP